MDRHPGAKALLSYAFIPVFLAAGFASWAEGRRRWRDPVLSAAALEVLVKREQPTVASAVRGRLIAHAPILALCALVTYFGFWYGREIFWLPPFGDAANHARIARSMIEQGPWNTQSPYPPLYHIVAGIALVTAGEHGFATVTIAGVVALGIAVYAFAGEVTGSRWVAVSASLIAFVSPKLPLYAGRMYMEIALTPLILAALTFMHRYLRKRQRRDLLLAALFVGLACLTKQQALLLLVASLGYLGGEAAWRLVRRREPARSALWAPAVFAVITLLMVTPVALSMFHADGALLPDSDYTSGFNRIGARLAGYEAPTPSATQQYWDDYLESTYYGSPEAARGEQRAEARHIWPTDVLTPDGFLSIHSTFTQQLRLALDLGVLFQVMLIGGLLFWVKQPRSRAFLLLSFMWLVLNYVSFIRENDQQRYYVYIAFAASFAIPLCAVRVARLMRWGRLPTLLVLATALIVYADGYLPHMTTAISANATTQAYAPSVGGMMSVRDASAFLRNSLAPDKTYYAVPTTEFQYYARRDGLFDFRIDFLDRMTLANYFQDHNVEFVVIPDSAVRPDETWNHVVHIPKSFEMKIASIYPVAYRTPAHDITIYRVIPPSEIGPLEPLDWQAPGGLQFRSPSEGETVSGTLGVTAMAHDNATVTAVMFYIDGVYRGGLKGPQDEYQWQWDSRSAPNGRHTLSMKAVDSSGNFSTLHLTIEVNN